jgi:hypothetical protein
LILVDSSVWIDFFNSQPSPAGLELERLISAGAPVAITGLIVLEVLQGLRRDAEPVTRLFFLCARINSGDFETHVAAAALAREARRRGVTIGTVEAVIATLALAHGAELFTLDQDFTRLGFAGLRLYGFTSGRG